MIELGAFVPVAGKTDVKVMMTARKFFFTDNAYIYKKLTRIVGEILEIGAYYSIRIKDIASFERYIAQLNTYYHDLA